MVTKPQAVITVATKEIVAMHRAKASYKTASGNHCCNTASYTITDSEGIGYKTASGNHCCNSTP